MKYTEPLDRLSYSLGLSIAGSLLSSGIADINVQAFAAAVTAAYAGTTPDIAPDEAERIIQEHLRGIQAQQGAAAKAAGEKFLADNAKQEGVTTLPSGLQYKIITPAAGAIPALKDTVRCHYEGRLIDGTVFDSSYRRGTPAEFPVSGVIAGAPDDARRLQMAALHPLRPRLRRTRRGFLHRTQRDPHLRHRAHRNPLKRNNQHSHFKLNTS